MSPEPIYYRLSVNENGTVTMTAISASDFETDQINSTLSPASSHALVDSITVYRELYDDALAEATELSDKYESLRTSYIDKQNRMAVLLADYDLFKQNVRDLIIDDLYGNNVINLEKANDLLDDLDLPGATRKFNVDVTLSQTVTIEVEASTEDEAQDIVEHMEIPEVAYEADDYDWEINITNVQESGN